MLPDDGEHTSFRRLHVRINDELTGFEPNGENLSPDIRNTKEKEST